MANVVESSASTLGGSGASMTEREAGNSQLGEKTLDEDRKDTASEKHNDAHSQDDEAVAKDPAVPGDDKEAMTKTRTTLIMTALCLCTFLAALDMSIVTTALPTIAEQFNASQADYGWIGSAYLLGASSSTPSWGKISDIFGRKPIILLANAIFLVGSLLCALSVNVKMLIASRVVQGIGAGGLLSMSNIAISDLFSLRNRSMFYALIGMVWGIAGSVGPIIGGVITERATWRWCFYINLPIDGVALVITIFFLKVYTPKTPLMAGLAAIDWLGSLTVVGGTVMFLLGLEFGGVSHPWSSPIVICLMVFGVVTWAIFGIIQWKVSRFPLMPTRLFSSRSTITAFVVAALHGMVYISGQYFLPLYYQEVLGESPINSGVLLIPAVVGTSLSSIASGIYMRKSGRYLPPIWSAMFFMVLGVGLFIDLPAHKSTAKIIIYSILYGIGIGPNFQAPLVALQSYLKPADMASATAAFAFCRNISSSMSVVIGTAILQNRMSGNLHDISNKLRPQTLGFLEANPGSLSIEFVKHLPSAEKDPVLEAYTKAFKVMWIFYAAVSGLGFASSLLMLQKTKLQKEHEITKTGLDVQEKERQLRLEEKRNKKEHSDKSDSEK